MSAESSTSFGFPSYTDTANNTAAEYYSASETHSTAPRADADAALHRAEILIAQGGIERASGFLHAAKARCA
jgi:hypothetical protein